MTRILAAALLTLLTQAAAQTTPTQNTSSTPLPAPTPTNQATPALPPVPPPAPLSSRLYAGASIAPSLSGGGTAYGIVVGSSQVFGPFGAQASVDYATQSGALSVDTLLLYRPKLESKFQPYLGAGLGLTSSAISGAAPVPPPTTGGTTVPAPTNATDYAAQLVLGSDYLLTDSIAAYAEVSYRSPFSSKGSANGAGARGRLGVKFLF
ncbi:hypothetical protein EHF33_03875 [Deinococcus psychrotolerans]|uniref:Outer membrane protein beta-barrel domain-containing protein n=1 Tax=Deinococcus psychrotolerans TaxID=2489213 RepID=A0A3G8YCQ3_9DEIO|nr:hypothetical protein [Deinococcus psychrotolerans]AZI41997.1 hypothetical protein EHF33_03875 [Deinococcus psychrotolerans]